MQPITVLSLFDGMSCGRLALERAGIPVADYRASEIDKYAIQVSNNNRDDVYHLGDVEELSGWDFSEEVCGEPIDLLIGGSPCQGFSTAGKGLNFEDPRSKLFFEFVRILNEAKPRFFLLENVKMKKEWQNIISEHLFGIQPVEIDSALVSAQRRKRLYRIGKRNEDGTYSQVIVSQPKDRRILLKDITIDGANKIRQLGRGFNPGGVKEHKSPTLSSHGWQYNNFITDEWSGLRSLTPIECERLQTLPDDYTAGVSNSQRYKMLGNGWTVDVIAHIFREMFRD